MSEAAAPAAGAAPVASAAGSPEQRSLIPSAAPAAPGAPPTPAVAETWWKGWLREDGSLDKGRLAHLPKERQDDAAILARYPTLDEAAKGLAHHARLAREKGVMPLRPDASPEERTEHMKQIAKINGAPDKPEGYGFAKPEDISEGMWREQFASKIAATLHKFGASPDLAKELMAVNNAEAKAAMEEYQQEAARQEDTRWKEQERQLNLEFGAFKQEKFAAAMSGARWMGIDPDSRMFKTNAALIIAAAKVGEKISDAKFVNGNSAASGAMDPQAELDDMVQNPANQYYDVLRNPNKNPRLAQEATARRIALSKKIAAKNAAG